MQQSSAPGQRRTLLLAAAAAAGAGVGLLIAWWRLRATRQDATPVADPAPLAAPPAQEFALQSELVYTRDAGEVENWLATHVRGEASVIGMDAEWRPNPPACPLAVLQLCCGSSTLIVHLCFMQGVPDALVAVLADARVLKVGVGIGGDRKRLREIGVPHVASCIDLQNPASDFGYTHSGSGLRALTLAVLNEHLPKERALQMSDWQADQLSPQQQAYAAADAEAAWRIFVQLYARHAAPAASMLDFGRPYVDRKPAGAARGAAAVAGPAGASVTAAAPAASGAAVGVIYDNCRLLRPNGALLALCSRDKLEWYVRRGLGTREGADAVRLSFEPRFGEHAGDSFYTVAKANVCAVCGAAETELGRYHIVPTSYRRHFPAHMKQHASHDIVPLCRACHGPAERAAKAFREELAAELGVEPYPEVAWTQLYGRARALAAAALKKRTHAGPGDDARPPGFSLAPWMQQLLNEALGRAADTPVDLSTLERAAALDKAATGFRDHAELAMAAVGCTAEGARYVCRRWRAAFVTALQPRHMPAGWSLSHEDHPTEVDVRGVLHAALRELRAAGAQGSAETDGVELAEADTPPPML